MLFFCIAADSRLLSRKKKGEKKEQQRSMNRKHRQVQPTELHHRQLQAIQQRKLSKNSLKNNLAHICTMSVSSSEFTPVQLVSNRCSVLPLRPSRYGSRATLRRRQAKAVQNGSNQTGVADSKTCNQTFLCHFSLLFVSPSKLRGSPPHPPFLSSLNILIRRMASWSLSTWTLSFSFLSSSLAALCFLFSF